MISDKGRERDSEESGFVSNMPSTDSKVLEEIM